MLKTTSRVAFAVLLVAVALGQVERRGFAQSPGAAARMPVFQVDPSWPKIPNDWAFGIVSSVATDKRDHVWILHRPRTVQDKLKASAAPPVLEFDANGRFIRAWGGPAAGYDWPATEHGITVDHRDNIWIGGSAVTDDMLLKFTNEGKFISQIGARGQSKGNADRANVNRPADLFVHPGTNEAFVADGYGNRRIVVFDAATGAFKRMWGAFGKPPDTDPPAGAAPAPATPASGTRRRPLPQRCSTLKDQDRRASATRSTRSGFRTTASCISPIGRTGGCRSSGRTARTSRRRSSIALSPPPARPRVWPSHPMPNRSSSTCRISATHMWPC